jgi:hypothetical protein
VNVSTSPDQARIELLACAEDPAYFLDRYVWIYDATLADWVPFRLWPAQLDTLDTIKKNLLVVILKARQLGLTWLVLTIDDFYNRDEIRFDLGQSHGTGNPHYIAAVGLVTALHLCALKRGRDDERYHELQQMYQSQFYHLNAAERQKLDRYAEDLHTSYPLDADLTDMANRDHEERQQHRRASAE